MLLTTEQICDQYAWLYTDLPIPVGTWDHVIDVDGAYAAIKKVDDTDYVMFRGSTTFLDWIEDFANFAIPFNDSVLGGVHPGFRLGALAVKDKIDGLVGDKVIVIGHSLGAGHAALYTGYRLATQKSVDWLIMFGEPKAGCEILSRRLAAVGISSFKNLDLNGHDLVTDVPFTAPPLLNYQHPRNLINVSATPDPTDPWLLFKYHHFGLYCKAFGAHGPAASSLKGNQ